MFGKLFNIIINAYALEIIGLHLYIYRQLPELPKYALLHVLCCSAVILFITALE